MAYSAEISRVNPTCFLVLVDQSSSMAKPFGLEFTKSKAEGVADAINRLLQTLVFRCAKGETILDRYHIGAIGYGGHRVGFALGGALAGQGLVPVSQIGNNPLRIETRTRKVDDGAGGVFEQKVRFPIWFEAQAAGGTPMCQALQLAQETIVGFVRQHPACFPPIVINISDGEATDGRPEKPADELRGIASQDGQVLLFNVHISSRQERPIVLPASDSMLPDGFARLLFQMSSVLPPAMIKQARSLQIPVADGARGFVFNADFVAVAQFLDIGTRTS